MEDNKIIGISRDGAKAIKDKINNYLGGYRRATADLNEFMSAPDGLSRYAKGSGTVSKFKQLAAAMTECLKSYEEEFLTIVNKVDDVLKQYEAYDNSNDTQIDSMISSVKNKKS